MFGIRYVAMLSNALTLMENYRRDEKITISVCVTEQREKKTKYNMIKLG